MRDGEEEGNGAGDGAEDGAGVEREEERGLGDWNVVQNNGACSVLFPGSGLISREGRKERGRGPWVIG